MLARVGLAGSALAANSAQWCLAVSAYTAEDCIALAGLRNPASPGALRLARSNGPPGTTTRIEVDVRGCTQACTAMERRQCRSPARRKRAVLN